MALAFKAKNVASAKLHETGKSGYIITPGVADISEGFTPEDYATQINKVLTIGGKSVVADEAMIIDRKCEVIQSV